jgi:phosphoribosylanthranilate isomerase
MSAKLKICGMKFPDNISEVMKLEPDYLGFIFYPASKRYIEGLDPEIVKSIPDEIKTTGVFVDEKLEVVKEQITAYHLKAVQLHGKESPSYCRELKKHAEVIKAFGIDEKFNFDSLDDYYDSVDIFLFDTKTPDHGGSGKTFNWRLLQKYQLTTPFFISGGIGTDNLADLPRINDERLYGVDVNSRFETEAGIKDTIQLADFKSKMLTVL